jgi:hypothetical protein
MDNVSLFASEKMKETLERVLADFAFLFAEFEDLHPDATESGSVHVLVTGELSCRVLLRAFGEVLPELAANMLGEAEAPSAQEQQGSLRELANVVVGNWLPQCFGSRAVFDLALRDGDSAPSMTATAESLLLTVRVPLEKGSLQAELYAVDADNLFAHMKPGD